MLQPKEDKTFEEETRDVEFLLYGGQNRVFTVHRDNLIKLWTIPLYPDETDSLTITSLYVHLDNKDLSIENNLLLKMSCPVTNGDNPKVTDAPITRSHKTDARLYRVFLAEGTVRNIHVIKQSRGDRFLTCEFDDRGNHVTEWNIQTGASSKLKGLSNSYGGPLVRILSVIYLSPRLLAVLVSDEGIIHTIDVWNTRMGVCVHFQLYKAYLPVQNIYNIHGNLIIQPWSSMAEIIVYKVLDDSYHKTDTGTLLTAPPSKIATYRCIISEETGHILAGGSTLKIFLLTESGKMKYLRSIELKISGKLLDMSALQSRDLRLLIIENSGVCVYNADRDVYTRIACEFKHRNRDVLVRADSGYSYRPYLFLPDNGILLIQDTYANRFYKYEIPLSAYVPRHFAEIRKNARLLHQYYDSCTLPAEMWVNVLSFTGYLYNRTFARKVANQFFCRPLS